MRELVDFPPEHSEIPVESTDKNAKKKSPLVQYAPHISYCNNLYVYPLVCNLGSTSGRNITIKVTLLDSDSDTEGRPLQVRDLYCRD